MHPLLERENDVVQDRVRRIRDEEVDSDPGVLAAVQAMQQANDADAARRAPLNSIRDTIDAAAAKIKDLTQQVADIDSARPVLAVAIAKGQQSDSDDQQSQAHKQDLRRQIELLGFAVAGLTEEFRLGERDARLSFDHDRVRDALDAAVMRAKIALAKRQ
jgi:hypothetical protein